MADIVTELATGLVASFRNLATEAVRVLPGIIGAIIILIVGIALGVVLKRIIIHLLKQTKLDHWLQEKKLSAAIGNREISGLVGSFTKWYIIALFLTQAVELIQLQYLKQFSQFVIELINRGIAAAALFVVGLLIARYIRHVIEATEYHYKKTIAVVVEVIIVYISVVIALQTIGINTTILIDAFRIGFTVLVLAIAILAGLLFAFAFRKDIVGWVNDLKKEVNK
jgi:hypothetical protein